MKQLPSLGLFGEEEAHDENAEHWKPKDEVGKVSEIMSGGQWVTIYHNKMATLLIDLRRSCQCYNPICPKSELIRADKTGQVWTSLDQSGQV